MCGVAGIYQYGTTGDADCAPRVRQALKMIRHRGPDAEAIWTSGPITLGHTRLAILDLDPRSNQPLTSKAGAAITYNGEVYNFRLLADELAGYSFQTTSDTEVLLAGFERWGLAALVEKLVGMFAFGIWEERQQILHLARDRAGQKPLYYFDHAGVFYFASEIKALLKLLPVRPELDPNGLQSYLNFKFTPPGVNLFQGVRTLAPGHYMSVGKHGIAAEKRYWSPLTSSSNPISENIDEQLAEKLRAAVTRRFVSDVPVCAFLSGGIDSSMICALAETPRLKAYTIGYQGESQYNEFEYAAAVAKKFNLDHECVYIDVTESIDILNEIQPDEPIADWVWLPLFFLTRKARADGYKVVLVGEGADEIFFGYRSYQKALRQGSRALQAVAHYLFGWSGAFTARGHSQFDRWRRAAANDALYLGSSLNFPKTLEPRCFGKKLQEQLLQNAGYSYLQSLHLQAQVLPDLSNQICYQEFYGKMIEILVKRVDRISMLNSLEARSPFLDHELVEFCFRMSDGQKRRGGELKGALKQVALRMLPAEVVDRRKMGFSFPFSSWLRHKLHAPVHASFSRGGIFTDQWLNQDYALKLLGEHHSGKREHASKIWSLYSLSKWYDQWMK